MPAPHLGPVPTTFMCARATKLFREREDACAVVGEHVAVD